MEAFVRTLLLSALLALCLPPLASAMATVLATDSDVDVCSPEQQRQILPTMLVCEPKPTIVRLNLPNDTYMHMAPLHVSVNRCGGSCHSR